MVAIWGQRDRKKSSRRILISSTSSTYLDMKPGVKSQEDVLWHFLTAQDHRDSTLAKSIWKKGPKRHRQFWVKYKVSR